MDNRYEEVPEKKSASQVFKGIGKYFKNLFGGFIDSFKYNNMKLPAILVAIPGLLIGFFLILHYNTIKQLSFTFVVNDYEAFTSETYFFPGVPFDASAISVFLIMLFGILNVFNALSMSGKKNLGSVVISTVFTTIMVLFTIYYVYLIFYYKSITYSSIEEVNAIKDAGGNPGIWVETANTIDGFTDVIQDYAYQVNTTLDVFNSNYLGSVLSIIICDIVSIVGVVLGFIYYDRTYEKVDR